MAKTKIVKTKRARKGKCEKCGAPCTIVIEVAHRFAPFGGIKYRYSKPTPKKI